MDRNIIPEGAQESFFQKNKVAALVLAGASLVGGIIIYKSIK